MNVIEEARGLATLLDEERPSPTSVVHKSGSPTLDQALGGGISPGIVEIYGKDSVGKTALLGHVIGQSQCMGRPTMWVCGDFYSPQYLNTLGVAVEDSLALVMGGDPDVWEKVRDFLACEPSVVAVDPLDGLYLPPEYGTRQNGLFTYLEGWAEVMHRESLLLCTVQVRNKLTTKGVQPTTVKLKDLFDTSLELVRNPGSEDRFELGVHIRKNALGPPGGRITLPFVKGRGVDLLVEVVRLGVRKRILKKRESWYYWGDEQLGQGEAAVVQALTQAPDLALSLIEEVE